jgi:uncharacterized membrane protein
MKKTFLTGLILLLPLALTLAVILFIFNFLTDPFVGLVQWVLGTIGLLDQGFLFLTPHQLQVGVSKLIILLLLFFFTIFLGTLGRWFFVHYFLRLWDQLLQSIPIVRSIYKTSQEVINTLFTANTTAFKQVVMVPFPKEDTYSMGFVTRDPMEGLGEISQQKVAVFVPTTPNPTSGFLMVFNFEDLVYLDISVEDAFKYIISCGVINTPFHPLTAEEVLLRRKKVIVDEK